jgi:hypothetical protein
MPRRQRLLQRRRNGVYAALLAALQQEPRYFLNEQWDAPGALVRKIYLISFDDGYAASQSQTPNCTCGCALEPTRANLGAAWS